MAHLAQDRDALRKRVRRIAGQVAAIERSLDGSADCAELLHLIAATRGALTGLLDRVVDAHLHEHVAREGLSREERARGAAEIIAAIRRYGK